MTHNFWMYFSEFKSGPKNYNNIVACDLRPDNNFQI